MPIARPSAAGPGRRLPAGPVLSALMLALVMSAPAFAQQQQQRQTQEVPVDLANIPHLHVTSLGHIIDDPIAPNVPYRGRVCNQVSTWTDASFSGGSYTLEAGMGEGEMFAATYTANASDFPVHINSSEQVWGTSNATVATTTQWSILYYSGIPTTGSLVATYSSDDVVLPHIHIPPGTNGVDVTFSIDPTDPEQLYIPDDGSHKFTVAWRIDHHNQQTQNPCIVGPPTCCNAFMVVDRSGVSSLPNNWLFGLNCGSFGCPPNGGWATFQALSAGLCRPSGDVITRTTWSSFDCNPGVGGCCLPAGNCQVMAATDCTSSGGNYRGDGTDCNGANCPQPSGGCCFANGFCSIFAQSDCTGAGGTFLGPNSVCGSNNTCPTGACCLPDGSCVGGLTAGSCTAQGGTFHGVGTSCSGANCPQPSGACCFPNGFCALTTNANCTGAGGVWKGAFTTCADNNGNGQADICENGCDSPDFNCDGDVGTDADIEAFFACLGGNCPAPPCTNSADFNHDGDVGTDADIESFFRVLGGGPC